MGDDWDPFADPAGSGDAPVEDVVAAPPSTGGQAAPAPAAGLELWDEEQGDDILAALRAPRQLPEPCSEEEFESLLDRLWSMPDRDTKALMEAFRPLVDAALGNHMHVFPLWRRGVVLMRDLVDAARVESRRPNLFGLLVDHQMGYLTDKAMDRMNGVSVDQPAEGVPVSGVVIFIFGWGGGTMPDLEDVAALYRELFPGAVVARLLCCRKGSFGLKCEVGIAMKAAAQAWASVPGEKPKLLVHLFSNAGFFTWTEMLQSWEVISRKDEPDPLMDGNVLPPMESVLRGILYDSSPNCSITLEPCIQSNVQAMAGFISGVVAAQHDGTEEGKKAAEREAKKAIAILIGEASPVKQHLLTKPVKLLTKESCEDGRVVHRLEPPVPLQFIYSRDDNIILVDGVQEYIERVIARPNRQGLIRPRTLVFDKSRHCFHKVIHRQEYNGCVRLFAKGLLSD